MKCHLSPKSWSNRATKESVFCGSRTELRYPCVLCWSLDVNDGSFGRGMNFDQSCEIRGFIPSPRGSQGTLAVPHLAGWYVTPATVTGVGFKLYFCQTPALS